MVKEEKLDYFMKINYDMILRKKDGEYCVYIPELAIIACGKSLDEAYEKLIKEKEEYFNNIINLNLEETVNEPASVKLRKKQYYGIFDFLIKKAVSFILFIVIFILLFLPVLSSFDKFISNKLKINLSSETIMKAIDKVDHKLANMSEKDQDEIKIKLRRIANKLKPMADELKKIIEDNDKIRNKAITINKKGGDSLNKKDGN